jgi:threonylcarbamoyladenosine tRNA methylthiotransferase MtaB
VEKAGVARADDFTEIAFVGDAPVGEIVAMRVTGVAGARVTADLL